jgi:hypothetical protein
MAAASDGEKAHDPGQACPLEVTSRERADFRDKGALVSSWDSVLR